MRYRTHRARVLNVVVDCYVTTSNTAIPILTAVSKRLLQGSSTRKDYTKIGGLSRVRVKLSSNVMKAR